VVGIAVGKRENDDTGTGDEICLSKACPRDLLSLIGSISQKPIEL
jgi:hypothetical protein